MTASHGALVGSRRANRAIGQICMGPSLHVEAAWDLGHNRIHHGYTTRQGFDFVWHPTTVDEYRAFSPLARLRHRLEWSFLGSGVYYLRVVWWQKMWRFNAPGKRHDAIVRDKLTLGSAVIVVVGSSMVIGALTGDGRALCGSRRSCSSCRSWCSCRSSDGPSTCTTSTPPSAGGRDSEWTQFHGQMESTTVVRMPTLLNTLWFHNIFVHVPHHVDARIPFHQLPQAADHIGASYPGTVKTSAGRSVTTCTQRAPASCTTSKRVAGCRTTRRTDHLPFVSRERLGCGIIRHTPSPPLGRGGRAEHGNRSHQPGTS